MSTEIIEISSRLMQAYQKNQMVSFISANHHATGKVAAVSNEQAFIKLPAKGIKEIPLTSITELNILY